VSNRCKLEVYIVPDCSPRRHQHSTHIATGSVLPHVRPATSGVRDHQFPLPRHPIHFILSRRSLVALSAFRELLQLPLVLPLYLHEHIRQQRDLRQGRIRVRTIAIVSPTDSASKCATTPCRKHGSADGLNSANMNEMFKPSQGFSPSMPTRSNI
jgi:hypothetical protein